MANSKSTTAALTKAINDEKVARGLTVIKRDPPRRFLALDDWSEAAISSEEFEELRQEVLLTDFPKFITEWDEAITRACYLLFALIESGGLCINNPQQVLPDIKIDTPAAVFGYLKQPVGRRKQDDPFTRQKEDNDEEGEAVAVRQPLHLHGANHLMAFTCYRRIVHKAIEGGNLLPELPLTLRELKKQTTLVWLADYGKPPKWSLIFNRWLKEKIHVLRKNNSVSQTPAVDWNDVRLIALWRLLEKERFPMLIAYRQRKLTVTNLPEKKMQTLLLGKEPKFGKEKRMVVDADDADELMAEDEELPKNFQLVRDFLNLLLADDYKRKQAVEQNKTFSDLPQIKNDHNPDLKHLLLWFLSLTKANLSLQTVYSYGQIVIRFLEEIYPTKFADVTTSDVAGYIDNTCGSPNTVRSVRNNLRRFKEFLEKNKLPTPVINWNSADLKAFEQGRERDILSEAEYQNVRQYVLAESLNKSSNHAEELILLTLLRRCGLRVGEASWLVASNLYGRSELRLRVPKSKTRTGTNRLIPIYLLLDETELKELKDFFQLKKLKDEPSRYLFIEESGERTKAARLGVKAENILKKAGLGGETAHGLRHGLASALFASLYLKSCNGLPPNRFTEILKKFCREDIEKLVVSHPYHIQLILGHADLFVTFDRYIHLVELAVWHAVESCKAQKQSEYIQKKFAEKLLKFDEPQFKPNILKMKLTDDLPLSDINILLVEMKSTGVLSLSDINILLVERLSSLTYLS